MKQVPSSTCRLHILVCENQRAPGGLPSCGDRGESVYEWFHNRLSQRGLLTEVWLTRTGCLGWCHAAGATVAVYPDGDFYQRVTLADCAALFERYVQAGS